METNITITTLHNLLNYDSSNFISAETHLKNALSGWKNQTGSLKLKIVLQRYQDFIDQHIKAIERFAVEEKINSMGVNNQIMEAFIRETNQKISYCSEAEVKDACLLESVQAINHFKISSYGTASAFARALDMKKAEVLFREMEINEKHIDDRLSQLAEYEINIRARSPIFLQ